MRYLSWFVALSLQVLPAFSGETCDVPVSDWKPREILRAQLENEGWQVDSIIALDGCYVAFAIDPSGHVVSASFDPKTLARITGDVSEHQT